ncbi:hypothetical protein M011DRAFT_478321 [Sporormia fimetaria CBS 119925]|uniref:Uncharacterized protein n=1 Tax=Sporormia fimetaria CBS 119925 TaxID=1340428 RepID=A0A6A6VB21_9PLEO|nr:hypothetical protein M011DRAFT_478321 [Sporormia fimetaria CBS 119925]
MSPAPVATSAASSASSPQQQPQSLPATPINGGPPTFDDIFRAKFYKIVEELKSKPRDGELTAKDRKAFIETAYEATDQEYFGNRQLEDHEHRLRALTKLFFKVMAEEPWTDDWIRPHDVERKLSRYEMNMDTYDLASKHGVTTPREAIAAARQHLIKIENWDEAKNGPPPRGPWDDIEVIYIAGTVSSTATNKIDRNTIYPISVLSTAHTLHHHICKDMNRPFEMAKKFLFSNDTAYLTKLRKFACDVVDYAPHLLDNDNTTLLLVLLILARSEVTKRFENNGIRIEGSTISHRRSECVKTKLGWKNADERKPFDNVCVEIQTRVRNLCTPGRSQTSRRPKVRKSSGPSTPVTPATLTPPIGYLAPPPLNGNLQYLPQPMAPPVNYPRPVKAQPGQANGNGNANGIVGEAMDTSA